MCGIAGPLCLRQDIEVRPEDVHAMTSALVHRGPDDDGFFLDPHKTCRAWHAAPRRH